MSISSKFNLVTSNHQQFTHRWNIGGCAERVFSKILLLPWRLYQLWSTCYFEVFGRALGAEDSLVKNQTHSVYIARSSMKRIFRSVWWLVNVHIKNPSNVRNKSFVFRRIFKKIMKTLHRRLSIEGLLLECFERCFNGCYGWTPKWFLGSNKPSSHSIGGLAILQESAGNWSGEEIRSESKLSKYRS